MDRPDPSRSDGRSAVLTETPTRVTPELEPRGPVREAAGNTCEVCGNRYDKSFQVILDGRSHTFDSFECAVHRLAPTCAHCGCRILGHGIESSGTFYCCANCARASGVPNTKDRS